MVYLVGAGPGDPGLLTLRAAELIRRADVLIHDHHVSPRVLATARPDAERVAIGSDCTTQEEVNAALLRAGREADVVVRLKVGDPFVFGRGAEEALLLRDAGIAFEVVPGVTAGTAAPAYAGIPVTHTGVAGSVRLVDAHDETAGSIDADGPGGAGRGGETLVAFMGLAQLDALAERLLHAGRAPDTPVAIVEAGSWTRQRTIEGTLVDIAAKAADAGAKSPAVVVVGDVVGLRHRLAWFEARPLFGRRVVVTRARAQAADFVALLESLGAEPVVFPTIRIVPPADPEPLRHAAHEVAFYDWVVFTSVNGVEHFWAALEAVGHDARALGGVQVACIGPATAAALELHGVRAELVPETYVAEAVLDAFAATTELDQTRILLPRAAGARDVLPIGLRQRGAFVEEVEAYRAVPDVDGAEELRKRMHANEIDAITFTSSSTVQNFVDAVGTDLSSAVVAAIGPVTAETARERGLRVDVVAQEHTIPGLARALAGYFQTAAEPAF